MLDDINSVETESADRWQVFTEVDCDSDWHEVNWNNPKGWFVEILSQQLLPQAMEEDWRAVPILNLSGERTIYVCGADNLHGGYQFTFNAVKWMDDQPVPPPGCGWFLYDQGNNGINWWVRSNQYKLTE